MASPAGGLSVPRVEGLRCRYCGAPLRVSPDAVVAVCPYCGRPNWLRGEPSQILAAKAPSGPDEVFEAFRRFAERDPDLRKTRPEPVRAEAVFVPFYAAGGSVSSSYAARGHLVVTITRTRNGKTETTTRMVPFSVSGVYEAGFEAILVAKRSPGEEAVELLAEKYMRTKPSLVPLDEAVDAWRRGFHTALAADRDPGEARNWFIDDVCDRVRGRVQEVIRSRARSSYHGPGTVTSVVVEWERIPCSVDEIEVKGPLLLPLVKVYYVVEDRIYRAYFAGWSMEPLVREEPFTAGQRLALTLLAGALAGAAAGAAPPVAAAVTGWAGVVAAGLVAAAGAAAGFLFARAALAPARRETGGPGGWVRSIDEAVEEAAGRARGRV